MIVHEYILKSAISRFDIVVKLYEEDYPVHWNAATYVPDKSKMTEHILEFVIPHHLNLSTITHELVHIAIRCYGGMNTNRTNANDMEEDAADAIALFWDDICKLRKLILKKNSEAEIG